MEQYLSAAMYLSPASVVRTKRTH